MRRCLLAAAIAGAIFLSSSSVAFAASGLWINHVEVLSGGPFGVSANFHIKQRHPLDEYNLVAIRGQTAYDGAPTSFAWEITDASTNGPTSSFRLFAHIKWPNSSNDSFVWPSGAISTDVYHNLKIERVSSTSPYWSCYYDGGSPKATIWWDYYGGSTTFARSQLEVRPYAPVSADAYMGHATDLRVKGVNNLWYRVESGWPVYPGQQDAPGLTQPGSTYVNPFKTQFHAFWYDWEGDL